jgi:hypothetical protein
MPQADKAKLYYEGGQTPYVMAALTADTTRTIFSGAAAPWSQRSGYAPIVRPDGVVTGFVVSPAASGTDNAVDVTAGTAYINGTLVTVAAATDVTASRGLTTDTHRITSITVTAAGAVAAVAGTDHTAFSETRDASGGPPLIAVTSIEIAQVRLTSITDAAISADEINSVPNLHREESNYPLWDTDYETGKLTFYQALPAIHTGAVPKTVYASYAVPVFAQVQKAKDFKPPRNTHSVNSEQIYDGRAIGNTSISIQQGSFTAYLQDGITDGLAQLEGETLWFKFYPDGNKSAYQLSQGILGLDLSYPASQNIMANCTISAENAATGYGS